MSLKKSFHQKNSFHQETFFTKKTFFPKRNFSLKEINVRKPKNPKCDNSKTENLAKFKNRALNLTLRPAQRFNIGQQNFPVEFLTQMLFKLTLNGQHLTIRGERGNCGVCLGLVEEVRLGVLLIYCNESLDPPIMFHVPSSPLTVLLNLLLCRTATPWPAACGA